MQSFDDLVAEFLERDKIALHQPRWVVGPHRDYASATLRVAVPDVRHMAGRVVLTAHRIRKPAKYGFALIYRGERILALDVNPARSHRNLLTPTVVGSTHWQRWPIMEAEPDSTEQGYSLWLHAFLGRANVTCKFRVAPPPQGVQLRFLDE